MGKLVMPTGNTDYELMRFRFANIKKSTSYLAGVAGMERKEFEKAVGRGLAEENIRLATERELKRKRIEAAVRWEMEEENREKDKSRMESQDTGHRAACDLHEVREEGDRDRTGRPADDDSGKAVRGRGKGVSYMSDETISVLQDMIPLHCEMVNGRLQGGFKDYKSKQGLAIAKACEALTAVKGIITGIENLSYPACGIGCGLEDNCITDKYAAAEYGWIEAMEQVAKIIECHARRFRDD